jgi:hypothetical protein
MTGLGRRVRQINLQPGKCFQPTPGTDVMIKKNIFAKKFGEKIGVFSLTYCQFLKYFDHNIGF